MNTSEIVNNYLKEKGIKRTKLAADLGILPQSLQKRFNKEQLDTEFLYRVSQALKHNFFYDVSVQFEKETGIKSNQPVQAESALETAIIELIKRHKQ